MTDVTHPATPKNISATISTEFRQCVARQVSQEIARCILDSDFKQHITHHRHQTNWLHLVLNILLNFYHRSKLEIYFVVLERKEYKIWSPLSRGHLTHIPTHVLHCVGFNTLANTSIYIMKKLNKPPSFKYTVLSHHITLPP